MRRILWWVISLVALSVLSTSCKDDEDLSTNQIEKVRKNKEDGEAYLKEKRSQEDVKEDPTGLLYTVVTEGAGERPSLKDTVTLTYTGKTIRDSVFVSKTETLAVVDLDEGLRIGVRHMKEGSNYQLFIPYYLMYGATSNAFIYGGKTVTVLGYSALVYDMTLDTVIKVE